MIHRLRIIHDQALGGYLFQVRTLLFWGSPVGEARIGGPDVFGTEEAAKRAGAAWLQKYRSRRAVVGEYPVEVMPS